MYNSFCEQKYMYMSLLKTVTQWVCVWTWRRAHVQPCARGCFSFRFTLRVRTCEPWAKAGRGPVYRGTESSSLNPLSPGVGIFPERHPLSAMDAPKERRRHELTTSVLFSPIIFFMHHPTSQPSSCFFTECTLGSCFSSARSWKWSWEKETHGQLVMLTSSLLPWEARWKWFKLQEGSSSDLGGQRVIHEASFPSLPPSHLLMIPRVCLHSKTKTKESEATAWRSSLHAGAGRPGGTHSAKCRWPRSGKPGVANITTVSASAFQYDLGINLSN